MRTSDYKRFEEIVIEADEKDPIWFAGYLWMDMTAKQSNRMFDVLVEKGHPRYRVDGIDWVEISNGFRLKKVEA